MSIQFTLNATCARARAGTVVTPHGDYLTPAFMPVATLGAVKGVTPQDLRSTGATIVLANAYHLLLRPGEKTVEKLGGLHSFMNWNGPILTDSGGYQVFSLASITRVSEDGVEFCSHVDGTKIFITPERATEVQASLGADIIMAFDECPSPLAEPSVVEAAVNRTIRWAARCKAAHTREDQALFAIVQGGVNPELRKSCALELSAAGYPGYGIGGLGIGEGTSALHETVDATVEHLPEDRPRYLMGIGKPDDIVRAIARGVDMFDCVVPTRNARNAMLFTDDGPLRMRNASLKEDSRPVMENCNCYTCRTFSRAYLRHLYTVGEMLAGVLGSIHNIAYYQNLVLRCRKSILAGEFDAFARSFLSGYNTQPLENQS